MVTLEEKVKKTNKTKEIVINVPDFVLCGSSDEEEKNTTVSNINVTNTNHCYKYV